MRLARRLLAIVVFMGLLIAGWRFADRNSGTVEVSHLTGTFPEFALWAVLLVAFGFGVVLTVLVAVVRGARIRLVSRRYRKLVECLQSEVHQLRSLPLSEQQQTPDSGSVPPAGLERGS